MGNSPTRVSILADKEITSQFVSNDTVKFERFNSLKDDYWKGCKNVDWIIMSVSISNKDDFKQVYAYAGENIDFILICSDASLVSEKDSRIYICSDVPEAKRILADNSR